MTWTLHGELQMDDNAFNLAELYFEGMNREAEVDAGETGLQVVAGAFCSALHPLGHVNNMNPADDPSRHSSCR